MIHPWIEHQEHPCGLHGPGVLDRPSLQQVWREKHILVEVKVFALLSRFREGFLHQLVELLALVMLDGDPYLRRPADEDRRCVKVLILHVRGERRSPAPSVGHRTVDPRHWRGPGKHVLQLVRIHFVSCSRPTHPPQGPWPIAAGRLLLFLSS